MRNLWLRSCLRIPVAAFVFLAATSTLPGLAEAQPSGCAAGTLAVTVTADGHEHSCRKARPDGTSVAHGYLIVWGKTGVKQVEGGFLEGRRHGRWITRGADGRVVEQQEVDRGTPVALGTVKETVWKGYTVARPDPPACPAGHAIAGSASPMGFEQWCERRDADGSVVEHGRYLAWNSSGWLREEGEYRAGRRHGRWTAWSVNRKSDEREYLDGELHGRFVTWDAQGRVVAEAYYRHSAKVTPLTPAASAAVAFACPSPARASGDAPRRGHTRWCEMGAVRHGPYAAWYPSSAKKEEGQ